jgi:hypothetical protein
MLAAIQVKELSLAQEARIIRRLEKSKRQSAKWAKEKQKAITMAQAGNFPVYEAKPLKAFAAGPLQVKKHRDDARKYLARIARKNHLTEVARKMAKDGIPDPTKYPLGALMASSDAQSLYIHRIHSVRPEARASHLALGFLRGKSYVAMENKSYDWPNWTRIGEIIAKYGDGDPRVLLQRFAEWREEGEKRGLIHDGDIVPRTAIDRVHRAQEPLLTHKGVLSAVKEFLGFAS